MPFGGSSTVLGAPRESCLTDTAHAGLPTSSYAPSGRYERSVVSNRTLPPPITSTSLPPEHESTLLDNNSHLVDLFYSHFWPAHPFLVPQQCYHVQRYSSSVQKVVHWIGLKARNEDVDPTDLARLVTSQVLSSNAISLHLVQALLLCVILLHAEHQPTLAEQCIEQAVKHATLLSLNEPRSAMPQLDGVANHVEQESIRRTWWELYIIDTYLAALHRRRRHFPDTMELSQYLPSSYELDNMPTRSHHWSEFRDRLFLDDKDDQTYSTYCYRIEIMNILERIIHLASPPISSANSVQAVDYALTSWKHNLPIQHTQIIDTSGEIDQMLIQAHCFAACASILLHFPRSDLPATVPTTATITGGKEYKRLAPASTQHTVKAIASSTEVADLATLPLPINKQSPLFACAIILSCVVQLAAATMDRQGSSSKLLQEYRERVSLLFGILKSLAQQWTVARNALKRLKPIASIVFLQDYQNVDAASLDRTDDSIDSGIGMLDDIDPVLWLDLFEPDQLIF